MTGLRICLTLALALGAAACSKPAADNAAALADNVAVPEAAADNVAVAPEATPAPPVATPDNVAAPVAEAVAAADQGDLGAYVGHYPFDKVGGVSFIVNPKVLAAVRKTVTDKEILRWVTDPSAGPSDTVYRKDGKIAAWSCQAHNCGDHNWTVLIDSAGTSAELCYHDAEKTGADSRWYAPGAGKPETRSGDCPASKPSM